MVIQWFPGHMAQTRRLISDHLKLVDVVIELLDARIPVSSKNPEIDALVGAKPRLVILNKSDMADSEANQLWLNFYKKKQVSVIAADSLTGKGLNLISPEIDRLMAEKLEREAQKGMKKRTPKIMVVGIPNVGKSSFINKLSGKAGAKTGDRPGVTQAKQWIRIAGKFELLDTPGILWPKFEDEIVGRNIAFTGGIKDTILDTEELASHLLVFLRDHYSENLSARYGINEDLTNLQGYSILELVGKKQGCLIKGGEVDTERASMMVLNDFRSTKIGKITLEKPV